MKNARGRKIPKEMFGKIQDKITCTVGLIQDSNLSIGTLLDRVKIQDLKKCLVTYLNHSVSIERSYNSNGEQKMQRKK